MLGCVAKATSTEIEVNKAEVRAARLALCALAYLERDILEGGAARPIVHSMAVVQPQAPCSRCAQSAAATTPYPYSKLNPHPLTSTSVCLRQVRCSTCTCTMYTHQCTHTHTHSYNTPTHTHTHSWRTCCGAAGRTLRPPCRPLMSQTCATRVWQVGEGGAWPLCWGFGGHLLGIWVRQVV